MWPHKYIYVILYTLNPVETNYRDGPTAVKIKVRKEIKKTCKNLIFASYKFFILREN